MTKSTNALCATAFVVVAMTCSTAAWAENDIIFDQFGKDNSVYITQVGDNSLAGGINTNQMLLSIDQDGQYNSALVKIDSPATTVWSEMNFYQQGNNNNLRFDSQALTTIGVVDQRGDSNRAEINQGDSIYYVTVQQDGFANDLLLNQMSTFSVADVLQRGNHLKASVSQTENRTDAQIMQYGADNALEIHQNRRNALVSVMQDGQNNTMFVRQQ